MEAAWSGAVGVALLAWFLACALNQFTLPGWKRVTAHDRFRLLPQWHFFAPNPARRDHHLLIRDVVEGTPGPWREIDLGAGRRRWRWLVNPARFRQKALVDAVTGLNSARRTFDQSALDEGTEQLSLPYLGLLAWATSQPSAGPSLRQFAVVTSRRDGSDRDLAVVYVSQAHPVQGR